MLRGILRGILKDAWEKLSRRYHQRRVSRSLTSLRRSLAALAGPDTPLRTVAVNLDTDISRRGRPNAVTPPV